MVYITSFIELTTVNTCFPHDNTLCLVELCGNPTQTGWSCATQSMVNHIISSQKVWVVSCRLCCAAVYSCTAYDMK